MGGSEPWLPLPVKRLWDDMGSASRFYWVLPLVGTYCIMGWEQGHGMPVYRVLLLLGGLGFHVDGKGKRRVTVVEVGGV